MFGKNTFRLYLIFIRVVNGVNFRKLTLFSINGGVDGGDRGPQTSSRVDIFTELISFNATTFFFNSQNLRVRSAL